MEKKLYRNTNKKSLAGVCSGISDYFNVDVSLVRLAFVLFTLFGGCGLLIYIVCAIVIPEAPDEQYDIPQQPQAPLYPNQQQPQQPVYPPAQTPPQGGYAPYQPVVPPTENPSATPPYDNNPD